LHAGRAAAISAWVASQDLVKERYATGILLKGIMT